MRPKAGARATVTQPGAPGGSSVAASSGWLLSPWVRSSPELLRTGTRSVLCERLASLSITVTAGIIILASTPLRYPPHTHTHTHDGWTQANSLSSPRGVRFFHL